MEEYAKQVALRIWRAEMVGSLGWVIIILYGLFRFVKDFKVVHENFLYAWMKFKIFIAWTTKALWQKNVTEQLAKNTSILKDVLARLATVEHETSANGGGSMKDASKRTEEKVDKIMGILLENVERRKADKLCSGGLRFEMNNEAACISISGAFLTFFSCQNSDVLDFGYENMVHEDDRHEMRLKWNKAIELRGNYSDEQLIRNEATGKYHKAKVKAFPIVVNDRLIGFDGVIEIINE